MKPFFRTAVMIGMMSAFSTYATAQEATRMNTKTIRAMTGAEATPSLSASEAALIVVDIQNEYYASQDFRAGCSIPHLPAIDASFAADSGVSYFPCVSKPAITAVSSASENPCFASSTPRPKRFCMS